MVISWGTLGRFAPKAFGLGPQGSHPPASSRSKQSPSLGREALAFLPAWASWMPATAPCCLINLVIRRSGSICSSFQRPAQCGVMRPLDSTAVASAMNRPGTKVNQMPVGHKSILRAVLAHRGNPDAIAKSDTANGNRIKKRGHAIR